MPLDLETIKQSLRRERILSNRKKALRRFLLVLAILAGAEILLSCFVLDSVEVIGDSMLPKLESGGLVVYNRLSTKPARGRTVVIQGAANAYDVKRAIALEGDVVDLTADGAVAVNGVRLDEPYARHAPTTAQDLIFPQTVPPGHVFVLGDNRPVSRDSRSSAVGMIPREQIKGTLLLFIRRR